VNIFLSHSRAQAAIAERLALSLRGDGHTVFFDQSDIEAGDEYDSRIRKAIDACELFVFLISPESVAPDSYPLAELGIAERRWPHPKGHVLPLVVQPVPIDSLPPYLRAVSVFDPQGDFVAESSAAIARIARKQPRLLWPVALAVVAVALLAAFLIWSGYQKSQHDRDVRAQVFRVISAANTDLEAGEYTDAFRAVTALLNQYPDNADLQKAQQHVAMTWLRNIRVRVGEQTFTQIVTTLRPVLSSGAAASTGETAGDLFAHLGWCEYLLSRDGSTDADPVSYFKKAVDADRLNPYAHSMWGFWILFRRGTLAEGQQHFQLATMSNRDRPWVRNLQLAALLLNDAAVNERQAVLTANTMRLEQTTVQEPNRLWPVYEEALLRGMDTTEFLSLMKPEEHVATFKWLFPEGSVSDTRLTMYKFLSGRLEESAGNREYALAAYQSVKDEFNRSHSTGSLLDRAVEGLHRLGR
jgi:tetratricopeptide (TPR) repeat protein